MEKTKIDAITGSIIGAAIEVHKHLGPGLLESAYEQCLSHELALRGVSIARQQALPVKYKGLVVEPAFRLDLIVEDAVIVELKCCERLLPIHEAQLITYLKLSGLEYGLLMNFNVRLLRAGIKRLTIAAPPDAPV